MEGVTNARGRCGFSCAFWGNTHAFGLAASFAAPVVYAHQPGAGTASNDLTDFSCHRETPLLSRGAPMAHDTTLIAMCWGLTKKKADRGSVVEWFAVVSHTRLGMALAGPRLTVMNSVYALSRVTRVLIPIASRISWSLVIATVW